MSTSGDIAVLQFGNDNLWHWIFLTPSVLSTLSFNASTTAALAAALTWSTLPGAPSIGTQMSMDSGWTAAAATGSKSISLPTWTSGGLTAGMITALNTVSAGLGTYLGTMDTQMAAVTARLSQLEATLAASKLPNA